MDASNNDLKACVIGWPLGYSKSPLIHNTWIKEHGLSGDYSSVPVSSEDLPLFIDEIKAGQLPYRGFNITIPHKESIIPLLDTVDDIATKIGAVNTVKIDETGHFIGTNTDAYGFLTHLRASTKHLYLQDETVTVLGAGGAARAAVYAFYQAGCSRINIVNRSLERTNTLISDLSLDKICVPYEWDHVGNALEDAVCLANTTSLGMTGHADLPLDFSLLSPAMTVYDIVYAPLETALLKAAKDKGCATVDGVGMLLHQAAKAFEIWTGILPDVTEDLRKSVLTA